MVEAPPTTSAIRVEDGALRPALLPRPRPAEGQALVQVALAGVNFWDVMQRRGDVPTGPGGVPGVEGTGTVVELGPGAPPELLGRRVAWSKVGGSYAGAVLADAAWLLPVPDALPDEQAAGVLMQGVAAQYLAADTAPLLRGDTAVVLAAAGGVGTLLTQLLTARGVRVVGVVGSAAKADTARAAGAAEVVADGPDLVAAVRAAVPDGAAAVFDGNGGPDAGRALDLLRPRGWLVLYGTSAGPIPAIEAGALGAGSFVVTRTAGKHFAGSPSAWRPRAEEVLARAVDGTLRAGPVTVLPLGEAAEAHRRLESRATTGKLLLRPGQ